ncbi:MAG: hypothetical protein RLO50_06600 [Azospirillaceae bacterium]
MPRHGAALLVALAMALSTGGTAAQQPAGAVRVADIAGPPIAGEQGALIDVAWLDVTSLPSMAIIARGEAGSRAQMTYGVIDNSFTILLSVLTGPGSPLPGVDGLTFPQLAGAGRCVPTRSETIGEWDFGEIRVTRSGRECRDAGLQGYAAIDYRIADAERNVSVVWQVVMAEGTEDTSPLPFLEDAIGGLVDYPDQARERALTGG